MMQLCECRKRALMRQIFMKTSKMVLASNDKDPAHDNDTWESGYESQLRLFVIDMLSINFVACG